jgi:hypothetical protein
MREIVIDTETPGLDPFDGYRVVEIGTVELINRSPTGKLFTATYVRNATYQSDAVPVHGLSAEFFVDKQLFAAVADEFLAFVGDAQLVAHNAGFDTSPSLSSVTLSCLILVNSPPTSKKRGPLAWHKRLSVYVAERYASKEILSETKREILDSIRDLARRIEHP